MFKRVMRDLIVSFGNPGISTNQPPNVSLYSAEAGNEVFAGTADDVGGWSKFTRNGMEV